MILRAVELDREQADRTATARALAALGKARLSARRLAETLPLLEAAVDEFADLGDDPSLVALHSQLARALHFRDDNRRAVEMADRALEVAEHGGLTALLADTLITKGSALGDLGRIQEGTGVIEIGERLARSAGLVSTLLRGLNNRSVIQGEVDPAATIEALDEGLALARRVGLRSWTLLFSVGIGYSSFRLGDWDRAVAVLDEALADEPDAEDRIMLLDNLALIPAFRGEDVSDAISELERLLDAGADPDFASNVHEVAGAQDLAAGRLGDAFREYGLVSEQLSGISGAAFRSLAAHAALWAGDASGAAAELAALDSTGLRIPTVEATRITIRAGLTAGEGRSSEALGLYREALQRWRDLRLVVDEAFCVIDMATLLDPADPEVRAAAGSAREILTRLRAKPFLARLDAAMERQPLVAPADLARSQDPSTV